MKTFKVIVDDSGPDLAVRVEVGLHSSTLASRAEATVAAARLMEWVRNRFGVPYSAMVEIASTIAKPGGVKQQGEAP